MYHNPSNVSVYPSEQLRRLPSGDDGFQFHGPRRGRWLELGTNRKQINAVCHEVTSIKRVTSTTLSDTKASVLADSDSDQD